MSTSTDTGTTTTSTDGATSTTDGAATTTDGAATATTDQQTQDLGDAGKKALDEERRARRAAEKELATLRQASMSEQEKAVEAARAEARAEAAKTYGSKLVDAELKGALAGKSLKPEALLSFDRSSFLTEDGDVDSAAITKWVAANTGDGTTAVPSFDGGARTTSAAPKSMSDLIRKQAGLAG